MLMKKKKTNHKKKTRPRPLAQSDSPSMDVPSEDASNLLQISPSEIPFPPLPIDPASIPLPPPMNGPDIPAYATADKTIPIPFPPIPDIEKEMSILQSPTEAEDCKNPATTPSSSQKKKKKNYHPPGLPTPSEAPKPPPHRLHPYLPRPLSPDSARLALRLARASALITARTFSSQYGTFIDALRKADVFNDPAGSGQDWVREFVKELEDRYEMLESGREIEMCKTKAEVEEWVRVVAEEYVVVTDRVRKGLEKLLPGMGVGGEEE